MSDNYGQASGWIRFLRQYGPVPRNENQQDEHIRRSAQRAGVRPLRFDHPAAEAVLECITGPAPLSLVLTGTAGDGKTHLCRQVWESLGGDSAAWESANPYLRTSLPIHAVSDGGDGSARTLHVVRDLSAWVPQRGADWDPEKEAILQRFSASIFANNGDVADIYLLAGNDGQLMESWRRLDRAFGVDRTQRLFEQLLVEDRQQIDGVPFRLFNLSRYRSAEFLDRALDAFIGHPGWDVCRALNAGPGEFFGPQCPIRRNIELLATPLVRDRLRTLLSICDYNRLHIPIRQVLLLLTNAVLGHPDVKDGLLRAEDVPEVIRQGTTAKASLYSNIFGGNLSETRRESTVVFDALDRLGIGHETSNRIDNIIIYGDADEAVRPYFDRFLAADTFYGADASFRAAQRAYLEGTDEDEQSNSEFLRALVAQRRGLFFKIPDEEADDMRLWELTVFRYVGEYMQRVVATLKAGRRVDRPVLSRLVRGLNRVFTGMLLGDDRELLLATSVAFSQTRVSRLLEERVSVEPRLGERVDVVDIEGVPTLEVMLDQTRVCRLRLHLTRYEFLSRVAEGALPSSFSKECYQDILAFKNQLLTAITERRAATGELRPTLAFQLLEVDQGGKAAVDDLEVVES